MGGISMKPMFKPIGFGLGAVVLLASPLLATPQLCPNARPGCGGTCHTDANLAKCPPKMRANRPSPAKSPRRSFWKALPGFRA